MSIINMTKMYNQRPSQFIGIDNDYTAYCFDEAVGYIRNAIDSGKTVRWEDRDKFEGNRLLMSMKK